MVTPAPPILSFLAFLMGGILLVQTALSVVTLVLMLKSLQQLDHKLAVLAEKALDRWKLADQLLSTLENSLGRLPEMEKAVCTGLEGFTGLLEKGNKNLALRIDSIRNQLKQTGEITNTALNRFSEQTVRAHRALIDPSVRLSAIIRIGVGALKQTISSEDSSPDPYSSDNELFV